MANADDKGPADGAEPTDPRAGTPGTAAADAAPAQEWDNMVPGGLGMELPASEASRTLDQSEIDSLLGLSAASSRQDRSGIETIVNSALVSYERLPMLEVVFDRLVRLMTTSLRNFTSDNVEVSLDSITSMRFGDYLNSIPLPAMLGVFKAEEWDNFGVITVDSALAYSVVDVLLGGRRGTAAMRIEGRPFTTIERNLVERMINVVLANLSSTFEALSPVRFRFERLETNPRFAAITRAANATIVARLRVDMEDRGGRLDVLFPYATLEPVREILLQMFMGEKFGRDSIWESHLAGELWQTEVKVDAVLDELQLDLGEVLGWTVGSRLELSCTPNSLVALRCGDVDLFRGQVGRKGGQIAVRIVERLLNGGDGA
ncbi:MAG: flagellar motor switch protein FliM [Rhodospirillaceae bacterium]|nr:flagellar motor switch protein FliM [Rhodospirillaceae bacterium]